MKEKKICDYCNSFFEPREALVKDPSCTKGERLRRETAAQFAERKYCSKPCSDRGRAINSWHTMRKQDLARIAQPEPPSLQPAWLSVPGPQNKTRLWR